jgi:hypothetical protein
MFLSDIILFSYSMKKLLKQNFKYLFPHFFQLECYNCKALFLSFNT